MIEIDKSRLPLQTELASARQGEAHWREHAAESENRSTIEFADAALADSKVGPLLRGIFANSPYLTQKLVSDIPFARLIIESGPDIAFEETIAALQSDDFAAMTTTSVMTRLRQLKQHAATAIGLADIAGNWTLAQVTGALSQIAEAALRQAVRHLLAAPAFAGFPGGGAGLVILGMGKLGARELNYSSDIDLVVFYDDVRLGGQDGQALSSDFARLTRALVRIMEERTGDGYVFRTDLRLRPDPSAMPLAVSMSAAEFYYGSLGQNWERAAMIKARQVAGDAVSGESLFSMLRPWIWRRNLDFAAIEDIHSIKRQINQRKLKAGGFGLTGYDIKLGRGGIREIEFYAQTQQLVFGGRNPALRAPATCDALRALAAAGRIEEDSAEKLIEAYGFLRTVEHRLQMVDDQQTHSLPKTQEGVEKIAGFLGYADPEKFAAELGATLTLVQDHFAALFGKSPSLSGPGNLVFTGVEDDPETLGTLRKLGYANPEAVAATVRGWHHGRYRATRSERAREILTGLTPALLAALAGTAEPDSAFLRFDNFLKALPAGVTLLSLFAENPQFLALFGRIMGIAPALAEQLAQAPNLLDDLISPDFFAALPETAELARDLDRALGLARDYEDSLVRLRRWVAGRKFQAGIHILENVTDGIGAGRFLAALAELTLDRLLPIVEAEFALRHGTIPQGGFAVVALGRLGGKLMSFSSDLDIIAIYEAPEGAISNGAKPLEAALYYTRLTQRLVAALSAPMAEGRLYHVDLRLRPSGEAGPVAVSFDGFCKYHAGSAWTWEHMALTRGRAIAGPPGLKAKIDKAIHAALTISRDPAQLSNDVAAMRKRIATEHVPRSRWDFKYAPGGIIDVEFTVQYLLLRHGHEHPGLHATETQVALDRLRDTKLISPKAAADLSRALGLAWRVQGLIRLTTQDLFDPEQAPAALKAALAAEVGRAAGHPAGHRPGAIDFAAAENILDEVLTAAHKRFQEIVEASAASPTPKDPPKSKRSTRLR